MENLEQQQQLQDFGRLTGIRANETGEETVTNEQNGRLVNKHGYDLGAVFNTNYAGRNIGENIQQLDTRTDGLMADYGNSKYDEGPMFAPTPDKIQNQRFDNQWGITQVALGAAKGVIKAGTTFADGLATWTLGVGTGVKRAIEAEDGKRLDAFGSGLWDNEVSKAMNSIDEWAEDTFKNYYSTNQERSAWYSYDNLISGNFLGDKLLKNIGFSVGAFYSGSVLSKIGMLPKLMRAISKSNKVAKSTAAITGAFVSAVNEGSIEALNNTKDWEKAAIEEVEVNTQLELLQLQQNKTLSDEQRNAEIERIQQAKNDALAKIAEDKIRMGNMDLLINIPMLTAENIFGWGKVYASGYKHATVQNAMRGNVSSMGKEGIVEGLKGKLSKIKNNIKHPTLTGVAKTGERMLGEGLEEMGQSWASEYTGNRELQDVLAYHKAILNGNAYERNIDNWKASVDAFNSTFGNGDQWEDFVIGALSSVFGMPKVRGLRNKDTGKLQIPFENQGGVFQDIREAKENAAKAEQLVDYVNNRLDDPKFIAMLQSTTGHEYWQQILDDAAASHDKIKYKDAQSAQFINDLMMFERAGMLEGVEELIKVAGDVSDRTSEEGANNFQLIKDNDIIKDKNGKAVGSQRGWFNVNKSTGEINQIVNDDEIAKEITDRKDKMLRFIKQYKETINDLDYLSNGVFSDDQLKELTWYQMRAHDSYNRIGDIANKSKNHQGFTDINAALKQRIDFLDKEQSLTEEQKNELKTLQEHQKAIEEFNSNDFSKFEKHLINDSKLVQDVIKSINWYLQNNGKTDSVNKLKEEFEDVVKLSKNGARFSDLYKKYLEHPNMLEEQILELQKQAEEANIQKAASDIESKLLNAKDDSNFDKIYNDEINSLISSSSQISNIEEYRINRVQELLKNSKNPQIKATFDRITKHKNLVNDILVSAETVLNSMQENNSPEFLEMLRGNLNGILGEIENNIPANLKDIKSIKELKKYFDLIKSSDAQYTPEIKQALSTVLDAIILMTEQFNTARETANKKDNKSQEEPKKETTNNTSNNEAKNNSNPTETTNDNNFGLKNDEDIKEANSFYNRFYELKKQLETALKKKDLETLNNIYSDFVDAGDHFLSIIEKTSSKDKYESEINSAISDIHNQIEQLNAEKANENLNQETQDESELTDEISDDTELTPEQQQQQQQQQKQIAQSSIEDLENSNQINNSSLYNRIKSWISTWWNFKELSSPLRKIVKYDRAEEFKSTKYIHDCGGLEFVDRGGLADANLIYQRKHNGQKLPIHFIVDTAVKTDKAQDVILAIEITPEIDTYINNVYNGAPIKSKLINGRRYLPVGVMSYYGNSNESRNNFYSIKDTIIKEYNSYYSPEIFVSSYTSEVERFYSGRIALTDENNPEVKERTIKNTVFNNPKKLILGIGRRSREIRAPQIGSAKPKALNANVPLEMRAGSVWLMIKGADGIYYPTAVKVARFNQNEYNWKEHQESPIIQKIRENLSIILDDTKSDVERIEARDELEKLIAFPTKANNEHHIVWKNKTQDENSKSLISIISVSGKQRTLTLEDNIKLEENVDSFMDLLMDCNYKFNVSVQELKKTGKQLDEYLQMLIDSDILSTNLISDHNYCASFEISKIKDANGNVINNTQAQQPAVSPENTRTYTSTQSKFNFDYNGIHYEINVNDNGELQVADEKIKKAGEIAYRITMDPNISSEYEQYKNIWFKERSSTIIDKTNNQVAVYDVSSTKGSQLLSEWKKLKNKNEENKNSQTQALNQANEAIDPNGFYRQFEAKEPQSVVDPPEGVYKSKIYVEKLSNGKLKETTPYKAQYIIFELPDDKFIYRYNDKVDVGVAKSNYNAIFDDVSQMKGSIGSATSIFSTDFGRVNKNGHYYEIVTKTKIFGKGSQNNKTPQQQVEQKPTQIQQIPVQNDIPSSSPNSPSATKPKKTLNMKNTGMSEFARKAKGLQNNSVSQKTNPSIFDKLADKYRENVNSSTNSTREALELLGKHFTLKEDITLEELNTLCEQLENCKGGPHIRFIKT